VVSTEMLRRVALVRTDVSEEPSASFIRVTRIGELGTTLILVLSRVQSVFVVFFGSKKRSLLLKFNENFTLSIVRNLPLCLQFTPGTRILLSPGRPRVFGATVEQIRDSFVRSTRKST
jgi:hypothetical protein